MKHLYITKIDYEKKIVTLDSEPPPGYDSPADVKVGDILIVTDGFRGARLIEGQEFEVPIPESWREKK